MHGYIAFFRGRQVTVHAASSYEAQQIAAKKFNARKSWEVTVVLADVNGKQVVHSPATLPI